jgi:hypothetical protein
LVFHPNTSIFFSAPAMKHNCFIGLKVNRKKKKKSKFAPLYMNATRLNLKKEIYLLLSTGMLSPPPTPKKKKKIEKTGCRPELRLSNTRKFNLTSPKRKEK